MRFLFVVLSGLIWVLPAQATNLQIFPVSIEVAAPAATTTVNLKNNGKDPVKIQTRLFTWRQDQTGDVLEKTDTVVVSPPFVDLEPGVEAVIRIIRLSKTPPLREEPYRLVLDELPKVAAPRQSEIHMVMRYSVPVFFAAGQTNAAKLTVTVRQQQGKVTVDAHNDGSTHVRLSGMKVTDVTGNAIAYGSGLNGYVLAGSANRFSTVSTTNLKGSTVKISANSNFGPFLEVGQLE